MIHEQRRGIGDVVVADEVVPDVVVAVVAVEVLLDGVLHVVLQVEVERGGADVRFGVWVRVVLEV